MNSGTLSEEKFNEIKNKGFEKTLSLVDLYHEQHRVTSRVSCFV